MRERERERSRHFILSLTSMYPFLAAHINGVAPSLSVTAGDTLYLLKTSLNVSKSPCLIASNISISVDEVPTDERNKQTDR